MSWTEEKVAKLKELWSKGHTASQIAEALGDTTRNAVIGKAHRLNLEARAPSKQSNSPRTNDNKQIRRGPAPTSRKAKFQSILLDKNFEPENPKSLEELTDETCKWPKGHPMKKNSIFAVENLKEIFLIANFMFCMPFNLKIKKMMILVMRFQNLSRKKLRPQGNSSVNGIY